MSERLIAPAVWLCCVRLPSREARGAEQSVSDDWRPGRHVVGCRGETPTAMAHGCAASFIAAGAAPMGRRGFSAMFPVDRFSVALKGNICLGAGMMVSISLINALNPSG